MQSPEKLRELAARLTSYTITPTNSIQKSQMLHRLAILGSWFGDYDTAASALHNGCIVELGCGQGDMTVALAHTAHPPGSSSPDACQVIAIDPAPLDYGSPHTLGESQAHVTRSTLGRTIRWLQEDPLDFLSKPINADFIVMAHSLFYLPTRQYLEQLLLNLEKDVSSMRNGSPKLLLAEWGMRNSSPEAEAHVLAVEAQILSPRKDANVRTVFTPGILRAMAQQAGWKCDEEHWIEKPDVDDGSWEVAAARDLRRTGKADAAFTKAIQRMEDCIATHNGKIESMDVWTGVFSFA